MYTAVSLVYPDTLATSVTLPMEILQAASQLASVSRRGQPQVRFLLANPGRPRRTATATGVALEAEHQLGELPAPDLLLLPAIWRAPSRAIDACANTHSVLRAWAASGTLICSVGTASCILAEAGLLRDRSATTHWNYFEQFARRYPDVVLRRRHLITQSGNIYCVGSVNSIADLMVHISELWFGNRIARAVEQQFSPEIRQAFRSAAFLDDSRTSHHDETILESQLYQQEHLHQPQTLQQLAALAGLGVRTFSRRFRRATGVPPMQYLAQLRINEAKSLLLHSDLSVGEISWRAGWQSSSLFSQQFRQRMGVSPRAYRTAVRGKRFALGDSGPA